MVFLIASGGHLDVADGKHHFIMTESLAIDNSLKVRHNLPSVEKIDYDIEQWFRDQYYRQNGISINIPDPVTGQKPGIPDSMYFGKAVLLSYISVPFYIIESTTDSYTAQITPYFVNSIILALTATVVYTFSHEIYRSQKIAFVLALFAGVCSFALPYLSSFFQQPIAGLMIILSIYFLYLASKNKFLYSAFLGGFFLGLIVHAHVAYVFLLPVIIFYGVYVLRKEFKKLVGFFIGLIPIIGIQIFLNLMRFDSVLDFGFGQWQTESVHTSIEGLYGMFLSPGFGLITNFPLFILFPIGFYYFWKHHRALSYLFLSIFLSSWLFFGTFESPMWHGYGGWGPRYFVPLIPIIVIPLGSFLIHFTSNFSKIACAGLAGIGFFVNLLGTIVWYQVGYNYGWSTLRAVVSDEGFVKHFQWDIHYIPIVLHWSVLVTDHWNKIKNNFTYDYWDSCVPDSFLYCKFGLIPVILMFIILGVIGFIILRNIRKDEGEILIS